VDKRAWARKVRQTLDAAGSMVVPERRVIFYDPYVRELSAEAPKARVIISCEPLSRWYENEALVCTFARGQRCDELWCKSLAYCFRYNVWFSRWWTRVRGRDQPMANLNFNAGEPLAHMLTLGWTNQAILFANEQLPRVAHGYFGYYKDNGALGRMGKFIFRLFIDWQQLSVELTRDMADIDEYQAVLDCWRDVTFERLTPALLNCCDWHLEQTHRNTDEATYEFNSITFAYPIEILAVFRLRELIGLENPKLDHPLMNSPLGVLPSPQPWYTDELLENFEATLRKDLPHMFEGYPPGVGYL
jgi:hypothetical protein